MENLENLFEDGILKIKFENLNFWKIYLMMAFFLKKIGILEFNFFKKMVVLENYSKNGISKN